MIEKAVYQILADDADVLGHVQSRIYQAHPPQNPNYPCIAILQISRIAKALLHDRRSSVAEGVFQVSCYAETPETSLELADDVIDAIDDYSGVVIIAGGGTENILMTQVVNQVPIFEPEVPSYFVAVDTRILYRQA